MRVFVLQFFFTIWLCQEVEYPKIPSFITCHPGFPQNISGADPESLPRYPVSKPILFKSLSPVAVRELVILPPDISWFITPLGVCISIYIYIYVYIYTYIYVYIYIHILFIYIHIYIYMYIYVLSWLIAAQLSIQQTLVKLDWYSNLANDSAPPCKIVYTYNDYRKFQYVSIDRNMVQVSSITAMFFFFLLEFIIPGV